MTPGETIRWHGPFVGGCILLPEGHFSGIAKQPVSVELMLGRLGFAGDLQVDTRQHGGPERAVCVYPMAGYRHWAGIYPRRADDFVPGACGENLCCEGIDEIEACVGDRWQLGEATLEISQPRTPCWKLSQHLELPDLSKRIVQTGRGSGWLCRVIQSGRVAANAPLRLVQRHPARMSIARLWQLTISAAPDPTALAQAGQLDVLAPVWRNRLQSRQRLLERAVR